MKRVTQQTLVTLLTTLLLVPLAAIEAADAPKLEPKLGQRGELIFSDDFRDPMKPQWQPMMKTRWEMSDGTLTGRQAIEEDQAKHIERTQNTKHSGRSQDIQFNVATSDCILEYDFQVSAEFTQHSLTFNDGKASDGTGHICHLRLHKRTGAALIRGHNAKVKGDEDQTLVTSDWKPEPGRWYHVVLEIRGQDIVAQIAGGPVLTGKHPRIATPRTWLSFGTWGGTL
jgi:hypothetical protein